MKARALRIAATMRNDQFERRTRDCALLMAVSLLQEDVSQAIVSSGGRQRGAQGQIGHRNFADSLQKGVRKPPDLAGGCFCDHADESNRVGYHQEMTNGETRLA